MCVAKHTQVFFPVLQRMDRNEQEIGHYFLIVLNLRNNRFEVLDSMRSMEDKSLESCCITITIGIKRFGRCTTMAQVRQSAITKLLKFKSKNRKTSMCLLTAHHLSSFLIPTFFSHTPTDFLHFLPPVDAAMIVDFICSCIANTGMAVLHASSKKRTFVQSEWYSHRSGSDLKKMTQTGRTS